MDVERAIEFLLKEQAKTEAMRQANEARWRANEDRWRANEDRWKRADERFAKKMAAINKILLAGMKTIRDLGEIQREQGEKINMLIEAQQATEAAVERVSRSVDRLIENWNRPGSNGRRNGRKGR
jgi:hypothetical protein